MQRHRDQATIVVRRRLPFCVVIVTSDHEPETALAILERRNRTPNDRAVIQFSLLSLLLRSFRFRVAPIRAVPSVRGSNVYVTLRYPLAMWLMLPIFAIAAIDATLLDDAASAFLLCSAALLGAIIASTLALASLRCALIDALSSGAETACAASSERAGDRLISSAILQR